MPVFMVMQAVKQGQDVNGPPQSVTVSWACCACPAQTLCSVWSITHTSETSTACTNMQL